jgi:hypothetical protein
VAVTADDEDAAGVSLGLHDLEGGQEALYADHILPYAVAARDLNRSVGGGRG